VKHPQRISNILEEGLHVSLAADGTLPVLHKLKRVLSIDQVAKSNTLSAPSAPVLSYPLVASLCYNRAAVNFTANPKFAADSQAAKACDSVPSQAGQVPELLDKQRGNEDPSRYCPVCSQRLESRRCKLICSVCGYYMSCTDYY